MDGIAIVGTGVAGMSTAHALRSEGFEGRLYLIGEETHTPYDRPSLSKAVLAGELAMPPSLVPSAWVEEKRIEALFGTHVRSIDPQAGALELSSGSRLAVDRILLATGARARRPAIPGASLEGVFTLRTLDDALRLKGECRPGREMVIIGGGLIGCEVATTARRLGLAVTILEAADELLLRVMGRRMGSWCRRLLESAGVRIVLGVQARQILGAARVTAVACSEEMVFPAELVLISVGAEPAVEIAAAAGLRCDRGILVDASGATEAERVFAAGDAACWPLLDGHRRSLETYLNTQAEAAAAASAMLGRPRLVPQDSLSWTEIAGRRLQMAGSIDGPGELVLRGQIDAGPGLLFRLVEGRVVAAVGVDAPKEFSQAARLVARRACVAPEALADAAIPLKQLLRQ
jgi:NADPH-dependent 2,4-dienoyl-CoA reductase/sulfur reductase-like enzyme